MVAQLLTLYLNEGTRGRLARGENGFLAQLIEVVRDAGWEVRVVDADAPVDPDGFAIFHMVAPQHSRGLTVRRVYQGPFWRIERQAERWDWPVAQTVFNANTVPRRQADRFFARWQRRLFDPLLPNVRDENFVYVPLQGKLLEQRSFQSCSPLEMIEAVLEHAPSRRVEVGLHPKEHYDPAELAALERLEQAHPRVHVRMGGMQDLLPACSYVVTQNSSVAFNGYFLNKPAVLFGQIDFHHIAADVTRIGQDAAFEQVMQLRPDYAGYVHWFWQQMSINASLATAKGQIAQRLRDHGWSI